jgi:hypothetical protein
MAFHLKKIYTPAKWTILLVQEGSHWRVLVLRLATTVAVANMATVRGTHSLVSVTDIAMSAETVVVILMIHAHKVLQ